MVKRKKNVGVKWHKAFYGYLIPAHNPDTVSLRPRRVRDQPKKHTDDIAALGRSTVVLIRN